MCLKILKTLGLDDEKQMTEQYQKQIKEFQQKVEELEEAIETERNLKERSKRNYEISRKEFGEISERLEDEADQTAAQIELNKR